MVCIAGQTPDTDSLREVHPKDRESREENETLYDGCFQG